MKEISIKNSIILGAAAAIFIPFFIAGLITYAKISSSLESLSREKGTQIAKDIASLIEMTMSQEIKFIKSVSVNPYIVQTAATGNYDLSDEILSEIYRNVGANYEGLFITDTAGVIRSDAVDKKRKGIDVSTREYFLKASKGIANFSIPVVSMATGKLIMVVAAPIILKNGTFRGIAAGTLNIEYMIKNISSVKIGNTGYAFVTDAKGLNIIHKDERHILKTSLHDLPGMKKIMVKMLNHETGSEEYVYSGIKKIAGFAPIPSTGWSVAFTQDRDEIMEPAKSILLFIAFSGLLFVLTAAGGIYLLSKRISEPIEKTIKTFNEITSHTSEIVITIGPDRKIIWANHVMESLTGIPLQELIGTEPGLDNLSNTPADEIWAKLNKGSAWSGRIIMKGSDHNNNTLEALILPVKNDKEEIYSYIEIGHNITHELQVENRLRQSQKIEAMGTLAGGIAHDFNNILAGIFGYAQISLMNLDDREKTEENIGEILNAAKRARDLVQQILTFSRRTEIDFEPVAPAEVIMEALNLIRASAPATIEICHSFQSTNCIMGDRTQLNQVIINLCTNAVYAMEGTGGLIAVTLSDVEVDEEFALRHPGLNKGPHVQLTVSDSGHGIEGELIDKIFDPFFTTKPHGQGTGLGLSVVDGIVKNFNGIITVKSEKGKGSQFNIIIPAITGEDKKCASSQGAGESPGGTERVLLIDDEPSIINIYTTILERSGYTVTSYSDAGRALDEFRTNPYNYDVVVSDYAMPHMTGLTVAVEIKKIRNDIKIILSSGFINKDIEEKSSGAGISAIIQKPATMNDLNSALRKVLDTSI